MNISATYTLSLTAADAINETVGGKGAALAEMARAGIPVPDGFHVTTAAYDAFVAHNELQPAILAAIEAADPQNPASLETASRTIAELFLQGQIPPEIAGAVANAYASLLGTAPVVAVRSSATAEDLPEASFAGQQETYLNIEGADAVLDAVKRCWASLWTARAIGYRARRAIGVEGLSLAVVVQRLVPAEAAGVLFTANPVNGRRDEAVINAAWGLGEAVVGSQVTPDTYTVDKESGQVLRCDVGAKDVMTVRVDGGTETEPVPEDLRRAPVLSDDQAADLVRLGVQIENLYGQPRDIEWALADGAFAIVQARPITALPEPAPRRPVPEPEVPPPTEWEVPNPRARYLRNNIVELMAYPLTPLFATLGRRVINQTMHRNMTEFLGSPDILSEETIVTIHGYAYYKGEFTAGQILRLLGGSVGIMRRMFTGMEERWLEARERYDETVQAWGAGDWTALSIEELLHAVSAVFAVAIDYYVALVSGVIPAAWMTEGLFGALYGRLIRHRDDPPSETYLLGFDSKPIRAEKALYDLARWVETEADLSAHLLQKPVHEFAAPTQSPPSDVDETVWREWEQRFRSYLDQYGRTIYDLDFANPTPADDPTPVVQTLKLFLSGEGTDPHARQQALEQRREQATRTTLEHLQGLRGRLFRATLERAQRYAPLREDGLADIGLGYPLVRHMLLEVGSRLVEAGAMRQSDDVFWLTEDDIRDAAKVVKQNRSIEPLDDHVRKRKAVWRARKGLTPPVSLPLPPRWLRKLLPSQFRAGEDEVEGAQSNVITGVPCSAGRVTAPARVLRGPEDFDRMAPGDVLVASITTPAWTPLFALASGIVTDVGGPLSHGSIVAREYGIPAVLGTGVATVRIQSGQRVTVDGSAGTVSLEER
jgi:phosphohistidine swiveling domain-containing protein